MPRNQRKVKIEQVLRMTAIDKAVIQSFSEHLGKARYEALLDLLPLIKEVNLSKKPLKIQFPPKVLEALRKKARENRTTITRVLTAAIEKYLANEAAHLAQVEDEHRDELQSTVGTMGRKLRV